MVHKDTGKVMEEEKKTIELWSKEFKVNIIDPDGFDRTDPRL